MFLCIAKQFLDHEPGVAPVFLTDDPVKALKEARNVLKNGPGVENVVIYQIMVGQNYVPFDSYGTEDHPSKIVMFVTWYGFGISKVVEKFFNGFNQISEAE